MPTYRTPVVLTAILLSAWILAGCSGSGNPAIPDPLASNSSLSTRGPFGTHEACWGFFDIAVDPLTETVDVVPLRGAVFEANVTRFLSPPVVPVELLRVSVLPDSDFPNGYVDLNISVSHPFPGTNLRGFDVLGIFMPVEGGRISEWDPSLTWPSTDQARLLNADGYTRWWNMVEFTSYGTMFGYTEGNRAVHGFDSTCTLNPYKYFADGIQPDDPFDLEHLMATDRGTFSTTDPGMNTRRYEIQFPISNSGKPDWRFKYAISASHWGPEGNLPPPAPVEDYPLSANRAEAVQISVVDAGSWAFWENPTTYGGDLIFNIELSDWQGLKDAQGPTTEVEAIYAESPTLFDGVIDLRETGGVVWEPPTPTMSVLGCTIPGVTPTGVDGQELLIIVTSAHPTDYSVQIPGAPDFDYPEDAILAAFTIWDVPISSIGPQQNLPPVADASKSFPTEGYAPLEVSLDPSASFDPDGTIVLYEWDIGNDGTFEFINPTPEIMLQTFDEPGEYEIQLRVTDDDDATDMLDEPLVITVTDLTDPCELGPNLICSGDGNIFVDAYVDEADNEQFFRNIINFDYGLPNSYNTVVKYYTGHGGTHNNSSITNEIKTIVEDEGYTLVDSDEEPIDTTDCRIIFVCLPGADGGSPFTSDEYETLRTFLAEGGRIVLTQEYHDSELQKQWGNDFLGGLGSTLERLDTTTSGGLAAIPNECEAITHDVGETFNPAYTSFELGSGDMSLVDDPVREWHVIVADWL